MVEMVKIHHLCFNMGAKTLGQILGPLNIWWSSNASYGEPLFPLGYSLSPLCRPHSTHTLSTPLIILTSYFLQNNIGLVGEFKIVKTIKPCLSSTRSSRIPVHPKGHFARKTQFYRLVGEPVQVYCFGGRDYIQLSATIFRQCTCINLSPVSQTTYDVTRAFTLNFFYSERLWSHHNRINGVLLYRIWHILSGCL